MKSYDIKVKIILEDNKEILKNCHEQAESIKAVLSKVFRKNRYELKKNALKYNCILITSFKEIHNNNQIVAQNNTQPATTRLKPKLFIKFKKGLFILYNTQGLKVGESPNFKLLESQFSFILKSIHRDVYYY